MEVMERVTRTKRSPMFLVWSGLLYLRCVEPLLLLLQRVEGEEVLGDVPHQPLPLLIKEFLSS